MKPVGVGIVGAGTISTQFIENFGGRYQNIRVVAVYDIIAEKAKKCAEKFNIPAVYDTLDELLADPEVEIVVNLAIPQVHYEINKACLSAGKHVYCEKPFAGSVEEGKELIELAKSKGIYLACAPDVFLGAAWQSVKKALDGGVIGKPLAVNSFRCHGGIEYWHPVPFSVYKKGAGILLDNGVYGISQIVALLGPVARVACIAKKSYEQRVVHSELHKGEVFEPEVNTYYTALLELCSGVVVTFGISYETWYSAQPYMEIHGTEGSLQVMNAPQQYNGIAQVVTKKAILEDIAGKPMFVAAPQYGSREQAERCKIIIENPYSMTDNPAENMRGLGVSELASAIRENREPRVNCNFALHILEILFALEKSSAEGNFINLETSCEIPESIEPSELPR